MFNSTFDAEPLAVSPREAYRLLGISNSSLYALIRTGQLPSFTVGRMRRIPLTEIKAFIARRLDENPANPPGKRGPGRPRKPAIDTAEQPEAST